MIRVDADNVTFMVPRKFEESLATYGGEDIKRYLHGFYYFFDLLYTDKFENHEDIILDDDGKTKKIKKMKSKFVEYKNDSKLGKLNRKTGYVPLYSPIMQQTLPNIYGPILQIMKKNGYININDSYHHGELGGYSKSYQLIDHNDFIRVDCKNKLFANKLMAQEDTRISKMPQVIQDIHQNYSSFKYDYYGAMDYSYDYVELDKEKDVNRVKAAMQHSSLKLLHNNYSPSVSYKSNRHFSTYTNLKKQLRQFITLDGEQLWNVDVKNSQPLLLVHYYNLCQDVLVGSMDDLYVENVLSGEIYKFLVDNEYQDEVTEYGFDITRRKVKEQLLQYYFSPNNVVEHADYKLEPIFKKYFPNTDKFVTDVKSVHNSYKLGSSDLSIKLQGFEAEIMLEHVAPILLKNSIKFIPIHDSFLVKECHTEFVKNTIIDEFQKITNLTPQIKLENCNEY
jgi:hypothetical protein